MPEKPEQPPEGRLIAAALERIEPRLTQRQAAERAGISDARWRQLVSGYISVGQGNYAQVTAPAGTLARMASVVGVTADQLDEVGREDAGAELRRIQRNSAAHSHLPVGAGANPLDLANLTPEEIAVVRATIQAMRQAREERAPGDR